MNPFNRMMRASVSQWVGLAGMLGLALAGLAACAATQVAPPRQIAPDADRWQRFRVIVWQYKTPPPGPAARELYQSLNLKAIHLDNRFSDALLQFARENGYHYYLDHAAGKGDLHLLKEEWDPFVARYRKDRQRPERPRSLWDPALRERLVARLRDNIPRAKTPLALGYAFDDEISTTSFTSPADVDWSPEGLRRFREWLRGEYGSLERLNAQWGSRFARWEDVEPKGVDDLLDNHARPFEQWNLSAWADHRSFMDTAWSQLLGELVTESNRLDPTTPAGFVGGQAPAPYGGFDYAKLTETVQWMEAYDIGATNEILRSFWGTRRPHVQTYFLTEKPAADKWFLWYYLVHGNGGVICWPDTPGGPWFADGQARPSVRALADTFGEVQGPVSEIFAGARFDADPIAVYYSQPSIQASWFMDIQPHRSSWVNRSSSMNNANATDIMNRWAWLKLLEDAGFQYEFVSYRDVQRQGAAALKNTRVLILPRTMALSDAEAKAIREWVNGGGTLIADYLPGVFDEHGRGRATGALDELFGVRRDGAKGVLNGKTIAEINAERYQQPLSQRLAYDGALRDRDGMVLYERGLRAAGGAAQETAGDTAVGVSHKTGKGTTYYANWTPLPYLTLRAGEEGAKYRTRLAAQLKAGGSGGGALQPRVRALVDGKEQPLAERLFWKKGGRTYLCVVWNPMRGAKIDGAGGLDNVPSTGPVRLTLEFATAVKDLKNERTGKTLGSGKQITDAWLPYEANIYSW